jgi:hypothetical protein
MKRTNTVAGAAAVPKADSPNGVDRRAYTQPVARVFPLTEVVRGGVNGNPHDCFGTGAAGGICRSR